MNNFDQLTWVCGHIGFANDSLTVFLNLHHNQLIKYSIINNRMRSSKPGLLLNWAWYYPRWRSEQLQDINLYQQLYLDHYPRFTQAHFFMREGELLGKFPGSKTLTILVEDLSIIDYYLCYSHYKLLDKLLYPSWYEIQKKNYPLGLKENQDFADRKFKQGMTVLQYRSIAFQDWQGKLAEICTDPIEEWNQVPYHNFFMENKNTLMIDHKSWSPMYIAEKQYSIYLDRLVNPATHQLDFRYYEEICNLLNLVPDFQLFADYWNSWLNQQPNIKKYLPKLSWKLPRNHTCDTVLDSQPM
jgi:hypothetical protein